MINYWLAATFDQQIFDYLISKSLIIWSANLWSKWRQVSKFLIAKWSVIDQKFTDQAIKNFLIFVCCAQGGTIFSGFDGLATVVIAAMYLQNFNVVAFEKDEQIWKAAIEEVTSFAQSMDNKMSKLVKLIETSADIQDAGLSVEEVTFLFKQTLFF